MKSAAEIFKDSGKVKELFRCIKKSGTRDKGMRVFAQENGTTYHSVKNYFYNNMLTPEIDDQLPRAAVKPFKKETGVAPEKPVIAVEQEIPDAVWDCQKDDELISAVRNSVSRRKGCQYIATKYGISYHAVERKLKKILKSNPSLGEELPKGNSRWSKVCATKETQVSEKPFISVEQAMLEAVKKKGDLPLEKEDIQTAADMAGVHYHTALSTWGSMVANAKALISTGPCGDGSCLWFKGDAFAALAKNGMPYKEIAKIANVSVPEVRKLVSTCTTFPKEARVYPLSFEFYYLVKDQKAPGEWLQRAVSEGWSTRELGAALKGEQVQSISSLKAENQELRAKLAQATQRIEKAANIVSLDHIREMYDLIVKQSDRIAELESRLAAAKKVSLTAIQMLAKKNVKVVTFHNVISYLNNNGVKIVPAGICQQELQAQPN